MRNVIYEYRKDNPIFEKCSKKLSWGSPEQEGKATSYWCFECDIRYVLPSTNSTKKFMKLEEIDKMESGQEIDALIAEKVMGFDRWPDPKFKNSFKAKIIPENMKPMPCAPSPYSTDIEAAWKVLTKLEMKSVYIEWNDSGSMWEVRIDPFRKTIESCSFIGCGDSDDGKNPFFRLPLAICRAALKTLIM